MGITCSKEHAKSARMNINPGGKDFSGNGKGPVPARAFP
jgi:hypothetical protein